MDTKEKELIAVAASVAAGCEYCTQFHVNAARENKAGEAELEQMVKLALCVRERATGRMSSVAWKELGREVGMPVCDCSAPPSVLEALASAASALAANCGSGVPLFLDAAVAAGSSDHDCQVALGLARKIKKVAAERADEEAGGATTEGCCASATARADCCDTSCS